MKYYALIATFDYRASLTWHDDTGRPIQVPVSNMNQAIGTTMSSAFEACGIPIGFHTVMQDPSASTLLFGIGNYATRMATDDALYIYLRGKIICKSIINPETKVFERHHMLVCSDYRENLADGSATGYVTEDQFRRAVRLLARATRRHIIVIHDELDTDQMDGGFANEKWKTPLTFRQTTGTPISNPHCTEILNEPDIPSMSAAHITYVNPYIGWPSYVPIQGLTPFAAAFKHWATTQFRTFSLNRQDLAKLQVSMTQYANRQSPYVFGSWVHFLSDVMTLSPSATTMRAVICTHLKPLNNALAVDEQPPFPAVAVPINWKLSLVRLRPILLTIAVVATYFFFNTM